MEPCTHPPPVETPAAYVHPLETNPPWSDADLTELAVHFFHQKTAFRHRGWAVDRLKVFHALRDTAENPRRLESFCDCGNNVWLMAKSDDPGHYRLQGNRCNDRFCVPCANENARKVARVVQPWIAKRVTRFVTLTLKHQQEGLAELLDRLYLCFQKLRETKTWKSRVTGGVAFFEIKRSERGFWHPHLHVIVEGLYFPREILARTWLAITGDSSIVDVRAVKDPEKAAGYVAKYATKGWHHSIFESQLILEEAIAVLRGRRLATTFGTWRGLAMHDRNSDEKWEPVMSWTEVQRQAESGNGWATRLMSYLRDPLNNDTPGPCPPTLLYGFVATEQASPPIETMQLDLFHNQSDLGSRPTLNQWA